MTTRLDKDDYYLEIARTVAKRSTCLRHQYGAVIVNNNRIISTGYNGAPDGVEDCYAAKHCIKQTRTPSFIHGTQYGTCVAVHAEINALLTAGRDKCVNGIIYLVALDDKVVEPCNNCMLALQACNIHKVVTPGRIYMLHE